MTEPRSGGSPADPPRPREERLHQRPASTIPAFPVMRQQDRQPAPDGDPEGWVSRTWEAIEPYQARTGYRLGRAQLSDGHTTESELCAHPWLSESRPGHDNQPAARACGDALAARLRAAHNDPASDPQ